MVASAGEARLIKANWALLCWLVNKCIREGSHVNWGYWFGQVNRSLKFLDKETKNQTGRPPEECTLVIDSPLPPLVLGESLS